jgi:hypothetical protein
MTRNEYAAQNARSAEAAACLARIERWACTCASPKTTTRGARKGLCRRCGGIVAAER